MAQMLMLTVFEDLLEVIRASGARVRAGGSKLAFSCARYLTFLILAECAASSKSRS